MLVLRVAAIGAHVSRERDEGLLGHPVWATTRELNQPSSPRSRVIRPTLALMQARMLLLQQANVLVGATILHMQIRRGLALIGGLACRHTGIPTTKNSYVMADSFGVLVSSTHAI